MDYYASKIIFIVIHAVALGIIVTLNFKSKRGGYWSPAQLIPGAIPLGFLILYALQAMP